MMGAVNTMDAVPVAPRHVTEKRMRLQFAGVRLVPLDRQAQFVDADIVIDGFRRFDSRIDRVLFRYPIAQCVSEQCASEKETLQSMAAQIEPVDRAVEALGQVSADLSERPTT